MRTTFTPSAMALALLAGTAAPRALPAQLTFAPPTAQANVAAYRHIEECLAASARVRDSVQVWGRIWVDTLPAAELRKPQASSSRAYDAARRCADNLEHGDQDLADFAPWLQMHLLADHEDRAEALLKRRLTAIAPDALRERTAVLDTAASIALRNVPPRLAFAERALDLRDEHESLLTENQLYGTTFDFMFRAWTHVGDLEAASRAARRLVGLHERVRREIKDRTSGEARNYLLFLANTLITMDSSLTALRTQGTEAYVAIRRESWARTTGGLGAGLEVPIGEPAPEIQADVWIGAAQGDRPRPTKGRVSLVVFVPTNCKGGCLPPVASIRRIVERFPELEVTLLASTEGYVGATVTPAVAEEAELLRQTLLVGDRLPGVLAMEDSRAWYLPGFDGRRVAVMPTPNQEAYGSAGKRNILTSAFSTFVVDREGTIVEHQILGNHFTNAVTEEFLTEVIAILFAKQGAAAGGAR